MSFARPGWAEPPASDASILLLVHGDELPKERLRNRVASELGRPVALGGTGSLGVVTVTYRLRAKELAVTWDGPKRTTVSRVVTAPARLDDVVRDAAILAGNLARDEASELIAPPAPPPAVPSPTAPSAEAPSAPPPQAPPPPRDRAREGEGGRAKANEDLTLGVFYPLATNMDRPWVRTRFDFNLFFGRIGQLDGFQLGGVNGVARIEGKSSGDMSGVQIAYGANIVGGRASGVQIAWLFNTNESLEGWQASAFVNHVNGDATGLQVASMVNHAGGTLSGAQAGLVNVAHDVRGAQLGLVNVGRSVNGTMIGLVNVADDVDGVPIGLASVTKSGGVHPQVWSSTGTIANVGVKLATKHTYTMPSAHYHRAYDRDYVGPGFTIGGHIPLGTDRLGPYVDLDASVAWLIAPEEREFVSTLGVHHYHEQIAQPRVRAILGWRVAEHFGVFGGAGLLGQVRLLRGEDEALVRVGPEFVGGVEL